MAGKKDNKESVSSVSHIFPHQILSLPLDGSYHRRNMSALGLKHSPVALV